MDLTDCDAQTGTSHGHALPMIPSDAWQQIEQAYTEIQRRDGTAEQRAWRWERLALTLLGLLAAVLGIVTWQFVHARTVQAFVQVVQVDERGKLVQIGVPVDLLAYTPPDGV